MLKSVPRSLILALLALALLAGWWVLRKPATDDRWLGYIEGETLYVAAPVAGRLESRAVERGGSVAVGSPLFQLDAAVSDASVNQAEAQVAASAAQAVDLTQARQRQAEIDVWRANEAGAQAQLIKASHDFDRMTALASRGFAARAQLDSARAARDSAQADLAQMRAQIRSSELTAGRQGQIAAAQANVSGAEAQLRTQRKLRSEIAPVSPAKGVVEQTFYNPGEWVPANSPVVSVLPDDRRKLRFYVPQDKVAGLRTGGIVRFTCDGCGAERQARISYIAPRSEFTPPVIYSERARAKLVFMVEALLTPSEKPLPLGLPVEVVPQ